MEANKLPFAGRRVQAPKAAGYRPDGRIYISTRAFPRPEPLESVTAERDRPSDGRIYISTRAFPEAKSHESVTAERDRLAEENAMLRRRLDEEMPVLRAALTRVEQLGLVGALVVTLRTTGAGTARWIGEFIGRRVD
jgi:hypothetical protein